jgi:hypothetical protein
MVFHQRGQKPRVDLKCFQRWVNLGLYRFIPGTNTGVRPKAMKAWLHGTAYTPSKATSNKRQSALTPRRYKGEQCY